MADALARLWGRFLPEIERRVGVLETAAEALTNGCLTQEQREAAHEAAHKLSGTLGTFGLPRGTELARRVEVYFDGDAMSSLAEDVAEWVQQLRTIVSSEK